MTIVSLADRLKTYFYYSTDSRAERFAARRWMKIRGSPPTFNGQRGLIDAEGFTSDHAEQLKEHLKNSVKQ